MAVKRKTYSFRDGDIIDREEFHDGDYGGPGKRRGRSGKPTSEEMRLVNQMNKERRARQRLLMYFSPGDSFVTWTYEKTKRPQDMEEALKHFQKAIRYVRREYKKRGKELFWIRNIEKGTKGAWHIHLVINEIGETGSIVKHAWEHGGTYITEIRLSESLYDSDFTKLAEYITKDENTREPKEDGSPGKPRLREANYSTSRNMPLPKPKVQKLKRWKTDPKPPKGYYIMRIHEGINPVTGYKYRRYTMARIRRRC